MIFVIVGTHEQQFDRLIKKLDILKEEKIIEDDIFVQIGYSTYIPKNLKYKDLLDYNQIDEMCKKASIIITHGGPGSIMDAWKHKKIPIVVPRNPKYNEHVDEHQILFTEKLEKENKIIAVYDIEKLKENILNYNNITKDIDLSFESNNKIFIKKFEELLERDGIIESSN